MDFAIRLVKELEKPMVMRATAFVFGCVSMLWALCDSVGG